jgi:hypothetical protein
MNKDELLDLVKEYGATIAELAAAYEWGTGTAGKERLAHDLLEQISAAIPETPQVVVGETGRKWTYGHVIVAVPVDPTWRIEYKWSRGVTSQDLYAKIDPATQQLFLTVSLRKPKE